MQTTRRFIHIVGLAVAGLVGGAGVAQAQLVSADVGVNPTFEQTGGGVTSTGGFFLRPRVRYQWNRLLRRNFDLRWLGITPNTELCSG
jgi:hypothetical protein